ncbi:MAG: DEAD/DEAH box helicase family protein [Anaerolineales bacterium]|nr:DEAD/DEAH box helicase family protein [Anaerolineales bacterium]NUQ86601.1 DEAD/DEAH box helicase family protein [Anaerolineales bacterium]
MPTPEELARENIDSQLTACGWIVQSRGEMNLYATRGVAVREFPLETGEADYLMFVDRKAVGVVEAKPEGVTLSGVAEQAAKYSVGLPGNIPHVTLPLPFLYESTGVETFFRDERDPEPRSRRVFTFHRPETLAEWIETPTPPRPSPFEDHKWGGGTLRGRLKEMPTQFPLITTGLWGAQIEAITNLEKSLAENRPRALIQMATGSGKTFTAVSFVYRLIKHAKAKRVLFLVDRNNLGRQAFKEFDQYLTPDDGRKFTELYNVQHLQSNVLDSVSKVHITTIQRLYSMLSGEPEFDAANEEGSLFEMGAALDSQPPKEIRYNPNFPIEYKDEITALEIIYSIPYRTAKSAKNAKKEERGKNLGDLSGLRGEKGVLTFDALKQLAEALSQPPLTLTTESLWRAYAQLERDRVRGAGSRRVLTDLVSLVRHAVQLDDELVPYPERVQRRYAEWLAAQQADGKTFTPEQRWWLDQIATHIGVNLEIHAEDFNYGEFFNRGGQITAMRVFGAGLKDLLDELNEMLNIGRLES